MRILGFEITRAKHLNPVYSNSTNWWSWPGWPVVLEPFTGAWQRNISHRPETVLSFSAVYACITLIASDIAKMRVRLAQRDDNFIWTEIETAAFSPVLRKQNRFQTRIQFFEQWMASKLIHGNTYVLKERDERGVVRRLYVLDPQRTKPMVAPDSSVFYQLTHDDLSRIEEDSVVVPASEIIHDRIISLYGHPLCGLSPISACAIPALQGLAIQNNSTRFFQNNSRPGGILTAPAAISDETAKRLKDHWEQNYSGENSGKIAVLGDGLKFESMTINAIDSQLIEQLKWTAETVCSCFHVPPYMIGVGPPPNYSNIEALNQQYYNQCLQTHIESIEVLLDEGLGLVDVEGKVYGVDFDLDGLIRMDTATKVKAAADAIHAGFLSPNEAREKFDLKPVKGGESPMAQQQNFTLAALAKRDERDDPFAKTSPTPEEEPEPEGDEDAEDARSLADRFLSRARHHVRAA